MTEDHSENDSPASAPSDNEPQSRKVLPEQELKTEAKRYAKLASETPTSIDAERNRICELLCREVSSESIKEGLARRAAASAAVARLAHTDTDSVQGCVGLLINELRTEQRREVPSEMAQARAASHEIENHLMQAIALAVMHQPEMVADNDGSSVYLRAITPDLDTETLQVVTKSLFVAASELQRPVLAVETLGELIRYSDEAVQAWSVGALGRLAEEHPDIVAGTADDLRALLDHADETVQHNTTETFAALVKERPDAVAPTADALRRLLNHKEVAIQHNAAGVLGRLVETHPDTVSPAFDDLKELCDHDDDAVRKMATTALTRLARIRPEVIAEG